MKDMKKLDIKALGSQANDILQSLRKYSLLIFIVVVGAVYAFILFQINSLSSAEPSQEAITSQVKAAQTPHIDQEVVDQLESLHDNSVNVQTLFDQGRDNPFQ